MGICVRSQECLMCSRKVRALIYAVLFENFFQFVRKNYPSNADERPQELYGNPIQTHKHEGSITYMCMWVDKTRKTKVVKGVGGPAWQPDQIIFLVGPERRDEIGLV